MPAAERAKTSQLSNGSPVDSIIEQTDHPSYHRHREVADMISGKDARHLLIDIEFQLRRLPPDGSKNHRHSDVAAQILRARIGLGRLGKVVTVADLKERDSRAYGAIVMAARDAIDNFNIRV